MSRTLLRSKHCFIMFQKCCVFGFQKIEECVSHPCQNNETCDEKVGFHLCHCATGFTGINAERTETILPAEFLPFEQHEVNGPGVSGRSSVTG